MRDKWYLELELLKLELTGARALETRTKWMMSGALVRDKWCMMSGV